MICCIAYDHSVMCVFYFRDASSHVRTEPFERHRPNLRKKKQCDDRLKPFLDTLPKGSVVQSRLVTTWGEVRDTIEKQVKKRLLAGTLDEIKRQNGQIGEHFHMTIFGNFGMLPAFQLQHHV